MPKISRISKESILKAAAEVVRKRGEQSLNARSLAEELNCSTQPIYSVFASMEELKTALLDEAKREYRRFIEEYLANSGRNRYECFGMGFVKFAREEKGLFRFLFMRQRETPKEGIDDPYFDDIIAEMVTLYKMPEEKARAFHRDMAVFSYGLAASVNMSNFQISDEEISAYFQREFYALYALYFPERPQFWRS